MKSAKVLLLAVVSTLGLLFTASAQAEPAALRYQDQTISITLLADKCTSAKVLVHILPEKHAEYRAAYVIWRGQPIQTCWAVVPDEITIQGEPLFFLMDETGDHGAVPRAAFKRVDAI